MELISREEVKRLIYEQYAVPPKCCKEILELPTIESRQQGKWKQGFSHKYECSRCEQGTDIESDYCAWCGADMRGEE